MCSTAERLSLLLSSPWRPPARAPAPEPLPRRALCRLTRVALMATSANTRGFEEVGVRVITGTAQSQRQIQD